MLPDRVQAQRCSKVATHAHISVSFYASEKQCKFLLSLTRQKAMILGESSQRQLSGSKYRANVSTEFIFLIRKNLSKLDFELLQLPFIKGFFIVQVCSTLSFHTLFLLYKNKLMSAEAWIHILILIFSNSQLTPTPKNTCITLFSWSKLSFEWFPNSNFKFLLVLGNISPQIYMYL